MMDHTFTTLCENDNFLVWPPHSEVGNLYELLVRSNLMIPFASLHSEQQQIWSFLGALLLAILIQWI